MLQHRAWLHVHSWYTVLGHLGGFSVSPGGSFPQRPANPRIQQGPNWVPHLPYKLLLLPGSHLYWFAGVAITNDHRFSALKGRSLRSKLCSLWRLREVPLWPLPASEGSMLPLACVCICPVSAFVFPCPSICLSSSVLNKDAWHWIGVYLVVQNDLMSRSLITSVKTLFPDQVPFTGSWSGCIFSRGITIECLKMLLIFWASLMTHGRCVHLCLYPAWEP